MTMSIERITEMFERAERFRTMDAEAWHSYQDDRNRFMVGRKREQESWLLGRFVDAYNDNAKIELRWAELREAPDFALFDQEKNLICHFEVTEWLDPGRRRDDEYKSPPISRVVPVPDDPNLRTQALDQLRTQLSDKFRKAKRYPKNTWLLISVNVLYSLFWGLKDAQGEAEAAAVTSLLETLNAQRPDTIAEIWILPPLRGLGTVINRVFPVRTTFKGQWLTKSFRKESRFLVPR